MKKVLVVALLLLASNVYCAPTHSIEIIEAIAVNPDGTESRMLLILNTSKSIQTCTLQVTGDNQTFTHAIPAESYSIAKIVDPNADYSLKCVVLTEV